MRACTERAHFLLLLGPTILHGRNCPVDPPFFFFINHWRSIGGTLTLKRSRQVAPVPRVPFPWGPRTRRHTGTRYNEVHPMKSPSTFVGCRYHFSLLRPFTRRIRVERATSRPLTTSRNDENHSRLIENSLSVWWGNWAPINCRFVFAPVRRNNLPVLLCGWTFVVERTARRRNDI